MSTRDDFSNIDAVPGNRLTGASCASSVPAVPIEASGATVEPARPVDPSSSRKARRQDLGDRVAYATLVATVLVALALAVGYLAGVSWPH